MAKLQAREVHTVRTSGRIDWTAGWIFIAVLVAAFVLSGLLLARANPMIYRARSRFPPGTEKWDLILLAVLFPAIVIEIPATLDAGRMGWSDVPLWVVLIGYGLLIGGIVVTTWAQAVNPLFEPGVRIQKERAQRVIMSGPYKSFAIPAILRRSQCSSEFRSHSPPGGPCCRLLWRSRCLWCGRIGRIVCSTPHQRFLPWARGIPPGGAENGYLTRPSQRPTHRRDRRRRHSGQFSPLPKKGSPAGNPNSDLCRSHSASLTFCGRS